MGKMHTKIVADKRKEKKRIRLRKKAQSISAGTIKAIDTVQKVPAIRQRSGISLMDAPEKDRIPNCPHGPCLLFTDGNEKWFSCAVYRTGDLCKYKVFLSDTNTYEYKDGKPVKFEYGDGILSKIKEGKLKKTSIYWCQTCSAYVTIPHRDPVRGPVKPSDISQKPTKLVAESKSNKGSAQYWFKPEVLAVLNNVLEKFDSVLCIGCPSVFEALVGEKKAFLMDFDHRFSNFYSEKEFAHFSMLNHHFYQESGEANLKKFFKGSKRLAIVVDPPFGSILSALEKSLDKLKKSFLSVVPKGQLSVIVFLPIFIGKHLDGMSMVDYKVTYSNHAHYKHRNKTIVRMFTDIDRKLFKLPAEEGYKFCETCQRYVSSENQHCALCDSCTTTFGPAFKHCDTCEKCVKSQYAHCLECKKCHLPNRCFS